MKFNPKNYIGFKIIEITYDPTWEKKWRKYNPYIEDSGHLLSLNMGDSENGLDYDEVEDVYMSNKGFVPINGIW